MKKNTDNSKVNFYYMLTIVLMLILLIVGVIAFRYYLVSFSNESDVNEYSQYYVMITEDPKSSFWQSVYEGAKESAIDKGIYIELLGSNLSETLSAVDLMKIAISSSVDGIVVVADSSQEMMQMINQATENGIPVVTLYNDNPLSNRCSYVGVNGYNIGKEYGAEIVNIFNEKKENGSVTNMSVAVLVDSERNEAMHDVILSGMRTTFSEEGFSSDDYTINYVSVDNTNNFSAEESIRDIFTSDEVPDVILCLSELNTTCAYQAVVDFNMVGKVNIIGYYDSESILNAIEKNVVYATASIDTRQMGQYCIDALYEYNSIGNTSQYFPTNVTIIDGNNIDLYLKEETYE